MVRVAHLSPDAPSVDVYVNGAKTLSGVSYKTVSKYLSVPPGQYRFEVRPAGADVGSKAVIDASDTLAAGKAVTVAAVGALANIKGQVYNDDISAPASGKAKVRVVHAARTAAIIALRLVEDVDLGHRRLTIAGRVRPIDELTHQILREWLDYRRTRWPCTANPHLIINQVSANGTGPVSTIYFLSLIHISEPTRLLSISYAVFCLEP